MQYSFERWARQKSKNSSQAQERLAGGDALSGIAPLGTPATVLSAGATVEMASPTSVTNPMEGLLSDVEQALPLALEEGMDAYLQHVDGEESKQFPVTGLAGQSMVLPPSQWDDLAKLVADHVLAALMENPLQDELERLKLTLTDAQRDNRVMAKHIQKLILENHRLQGVLGEQGPPAS